MAARVASVSGLWSSTATWGGSAVPVNGDTFTINAGIDVEYNADESGFATGLGASTINGTLHASRAAGSYILKIAANLTISTTGTLDCSDGAGGAYPANCTVQFTFDASHGVVIAGNGLLNILCQDSPTHKYVHLSQAQNATDTVMHIDADVTGAGDSGYWVSGAIVRIDNINQTNQSEQGTISGSPTSTTITLASGLTNSKLQGSYIFLVSRNVKFVASATGGTLITGAGIVAGAAQKVSAEFRGASNGLLNIYKSIVGGVFAGMGIGIAVGASMCSAIITGCSTGLSQPISVNFTGVISGATTGWNGNSAADMGLMAGLITGCGNAMSTVGGLVLTGTIANSNSALATFAGWVIGRSAQFINNHSDAINTRSMQMFNCAVSAAPTNALIARLGDNAAGPEDYAESYDHNQVAGAYKAGTLGGLTDGVASPVYDSTRVRSYKLQLSSAVYAHFWQKQIFIPAGGSAYVRCYIQKDTSMTFLPRLQIFSADKAPLVTGLSVDVEVQMTNSTNTWEVLEATLTNTTNETRPYTVRVMAENASGNVYCDPIIRVSGMMIDAGMSGGMAA